MDGWVDGWKDGWMDGWMEAKEGLRIAYSNQKHKMLVISENCIISSEIKFEIENVQHLRQKL